VFDSKQRLGAEIERLLAGMLGASSGRYACVMEPERILFETPAAEGKLLALRLFLEEKGRPLFRIPAGLAADAPLDDVFEGWEHDDFFITILNGRVALVLACPEAAAAQAASERALPALTDLLLRFDESYRLDPRGRGLIFGRARLDSVVVERTSRHPAE
jgi:hypothetical protein